LDRFYVTTAHARVHARTHARTHAHPGLSKAGVGAGTQ